MTKKIQNLVAVTGTYKNKDGEEKKRYLTVGKLVTKDDDTQFAILEPWFNPVAVGSRNDNGELSVFLGVYDQEDRDNKAKPVTAKASNVPF
jgi:hypothetical protein